MILERIGTIELPAHANAGGFDHAAVHRASGQVYVAHTANDAVDVIDGERRRYLRSISGLEGVAGVLVSDESDVVFTSNRGEDTVSIIPVGREAEAERVGVGLHPNGLAFDQSRNLLLTANVGDSEVPNSHTVSLVDVAARRMIASVVVPGRTGWAVYDDEAGAFWVNIRNPPQIVVVDARDPARIARATRIPAPGPHGLDLDRERRRLYCACDAARLVVVELPSGRIADERALSGPPDVVFLNQSRHHLYVAVGDPGVIDVFDTDSLERIESCPTGKGAHTIALDATRNRIYAFLPETHAIALFEDTEG